MLTNNFVYNFPRLGIENRFMDDTRSDRQLPPGVPRGVWDYTQADFIASDYDRYFENHGLMKYDMEVVKQFAPEAGRVLDLGCGTGRAILELANSQRPGIAVDLSQRMLELVRTKATAANKPVCCVRANLVELDFLPSDSIEYAVCLFSTLGMIKTQRARQVMLDQVARVLTPSGHLVLHVHNRWFNLYDPGGPWWLFGSLMRAPFFKDLEVGDKYYAYRGINNFYLHVFSKREISRLLRMAGLRVAKWIPLNAACDGFLAQPNRLESLRASGWIMICKRV